MLEKGLDISSGQVSLVLGNIIPVSIVLFISKWTEEDFCLWMQMRHESGDLNGLWEFPGGKIEPGESSEGAACREVAEEVGISLLESDLSHLLLHPYQYRDRSICLYTYFAFKEKMPSDDVASKWFKISFQEKSAYLKGKIPAVNHHLIDTLADHLKSQLEVRDLINSERAK